MPKQVLANLGFMLQISGILTVIPIFVGFIYNETQAIIAILLACVTFLSTGFLLNSLCEKKDLDFEESHFLFLLAFIILPLIGSIPYLYLSFSVPSVGALDSFTNGVFESVSGFTTTGFSFVQMPELLPNAIRIYRSLTELMGGIGLVFLLISFFESKKSLENLSESTGIVQIDGNLKKTYLSIFSHYTIAILIFVILFILIGFTNPIDTITFVIDTLTGGFTPSNTQFQSYLGVIPRLVTVFLMIFGALNFVSVYYFFRRKLKEALTEEVFFFLLITLIASILVSIAARINFFDSIYHIVSLSASVGLSYIPLTSFNDTSLTIMIIAMIIGGCTFSLAGGIRVSRIISFIKETKEKIQDILTNQTQHTKQTLSNINGKPENDLPATYFIAIYILTFIVFTAIYTTMGTSLTVSLLEMGSAITTNGITFGTITITMPLFYKWLIIIAMTIGRVEILSFLIVAYALLKKTPIRLPTYSKFSNKAEETVLTAIDIIAHLLSQLKKWIINLIKNIR